MHTTNRIAATVALMGLTVLAQPSDGVAQLANASAAQLGAGGTGTATARRFSAISVNPAGLGMPGAGFSLALAPLTVRQGLGPVGLGDLKDVGGQVVSSTVKEAWLDRIQTQGHQAGSVSAEWTAFALTVGRVGFQLSTIGGGTMKLAPGMAETILYGNAGRTGTPADLSLAGSSMDGFAVTTAGLSFGVPLPSETGAMALGATLKYSVGHVVAVGTDQGSALQSNPIRADIRFPVVMVDDEEYSANSGGGVGLDLGFQMTRDRLHLGAAVQNLFHTFAWDEDKLVFRSGTALLEQGNNSTDFDRAAYGSAPAVLRQAVEGMTFDPTLALGAAYDMQPDLTLSADLRNRFGDGMSLTPKLHLGAGAEYRGLGALHLRGGGAVVTDGFQVGAGATLVLGGVNLSWGVALQKGDLEDTSIAQFALSFGGR